MYLLVMLVMSACTFKGASGDEEAVDTSLVAQASLSATPCTSVTLDTPRQNFFGHTGKKISLNAAAICPLGQTPEFQYWQKRRADHRWSIVGPHVSGSFDWLPPSADTWCVTAVVRAVGAPEDYQARASARCGTIHPHNPPVANDDAFTMAANTSADFDVLNNDGDPDGDTIFVTSATQPAHGIAFVSLFGGVQYTPNADFVGNDSLTYTMSDGLDSSTATVNVRILQ